MSTKSWYALKARAIPSRYGLSKNIQTLLQALDSYHTGGTDAAELGRLVRLSHKHRASIANTITKCANHIKRDPEELKTCVELIEMCTEILEIADRPPPINGFPFMRLPLEIRDHVMKLMIDNVFETPVVRPAKYEITCNCPAIELAFRPTQCVQMHGLAATVGPALYADFFRVFFERKAVRFQCCCQLQAHLQNNKSLAAHVRRVYVHWCGPESATAFKQLAECTRLRELKLFISKSTLAHLSERASLMKTFFPLAYRHIRITDAMGLDELLAIRGLAKVAVHHLTSKHSNLATETDRANLAQLLSTQLERPKEG